ncbi:MAG: peptide chain release factor-like protein [Deltaproteobacteria bacterium]|nr:peptide chain release factor-like protein [Candidatus Zymogenaceae bacterium]
MITPEKKLLFSVTAKDCRWDYYRGSGKGGQHRNKKDTAVRCTHIESGAVGQSEDQRSQAQNKKLAFRRMAESATFKAWHKRKVAELNGMSQRIESDIERDLADPSVTKIEVLRNGEWVEGKIKC